MTPRDWALRYAALGWRAYPVEPGRKNALFTGWQTSATADPELIARQWHREPYPNVGLIAGKAFAVFDIEAAHLGTLFQYMDRGRHVLPETPVSATGRGGIHVYVRPIQDVTTTRRLRIGDVHVGEFKTTGGVIAPPSITVRAYHWLWWPGDDTLADAPSWLRSLTAERHPALYDERGPRERPADPALALDVLACAVRDEPEGNRNALLFWAACRAFEEGIRGDIVETVLVRAASAAGLPEHEARATVASARQRLRVPT